MSSGTVLGGGAGLTAAERTDAVSLPPQMNEEARTVLLEQERVLRYERRFGADEALELGNAAAELARSYDRGVTVEITREEDGLVLFSWSMDDKSPRNARFAAGKRRAVALCGHASLMCFVEHELTGAYDDCFPARRGPCAGAPRSGAAAPKIPDICPSGGAFPIRIGDAWVATLAISGLHNGQDHELGVRALCAALGLTYGKDVPIYAHPAI